MNDYKARGSHRFHKEHAMARVPIARVRQRDTAQVAPAQHRLKIGRSAEVNAPHLQDKVTIRFHLAPL
jgi:hypothetical protein